MLTYMKLAVTVKNSYFFLTDNLLSCGSPVIEQKFFIHAMKYHFLCYIFEN